jgi:hypothetical protein
MSDPADRVDVLSPEVVHLRGEVARLERSIIREREEAQKAKELRKQVVNLERELGLLERVGHRNAPPKWLKAPPKRSAVEHHGTPWLLLSDLHLDEVVLPAEVLGVNAFNREIAVLRLKETFSNATKICRDYWSNITYDGFVLALGGDIFSGIIHEELKETNEDTILGSLDFWIDHVAAGINMLTEEFGKVHVPVVVGNHGRMSRKPRSKMRARDNFDWFLGKALMRMFRSDERITFDVSESPDVLVPSYGHTVAMTHGDQTTGGSGIGGIWPPIMRLDARKRQRYSAVDMPYDLLVMGHWHQLTFGPNWIVNGAMKGFDEYAFTQNFGYEPPSQALWLMTPEHGKTWTAPVYSENRKAEGW